MLRAFYQKYIISNYNFVIGFLFCIGLQQFTQPDLYFYSITLSISAVWLFTYFKRKTKVIKTLIGEKKLEYVYTDKFGYNYYQFTDFQNMSGLRFQRATIFTKEADFCITLPRLKNLWEKSIRFANAGNLKSMFEVQSEIFKRFELAGERETLLRLASVYFIREDENPTEYEDRFNTKKIENWKKDMNAESFFLQMAWQRTPKAQTFSELDIMQFLKKTESENLIQNLT